MYKMVEGSEKIDYSERLNDILQRSKEGASKAGSFLKDAAGKTMPTVKKLGWDPQQEWYLKSTFATIAARVVRCLAIISLWTTCFLAFAYYPYHLQIRRISGVVKVGIQTSELITAAQAAVQPNCTGGALDSMVKEFEVLRVGDNLGYAPYHAGDEARYEEIRDEIDEWRAGDSVAGVFNVWEDMQFLSRLLAVGEWLLLAMITLYTLSFLNYVLVGTFILIMGSKGDKAGLVSRYEFWSQLIYAIIGLLTLALVVAHGISSFELERRQLQVSSAQNYVCNPSRRGCFVNDDMELCEFLNKEGGDLCASDAFPVAECKIFGQDTMTTSDVISFGQYRFGGYSCGKDYPQGGYCPHSDFRTEMVKMASKAYWATLGEGPELSLGVSEYSFSSTQGLIISMHVFGGFFFVLTFIDFMFLIYSIVLISIEGKWDVVGQDVNKAGKFLKGMTSGRMLKVSMP